MYVGGAKYSECEYFCLHVLTIGTTTKPQPSGMGEGGMPSNRGRGPDLTAYLAGLQSHSRSHWGRCSTRTGPKHVGSLVCTESLRMYVGYTNSFSIQSVAHGWSVTPFFWAKHPLSSPQIKPASAAKPISACL
jgi:hypothetical protein